MREQLFIEYLEGHITAGELSRDLNGSIVKTGYDTSRIMVEQIEVEGDEEFEFTAEHLDKILNDVIKGELTPDNLHTLASSLMFSDFITWDGQTKLGERISNIILELDNPEINFPINYKNTELWSEYLKTGVHKLRTK